MPLYMINLGTFDGRGPFEDKTALAEGTEDVIDSDSLVISIDEEGKITEVSDAGDFLATEDVEA